MNYSPLLSIIVPVYNTARFLPRCLESLLGQTYTHLEIICVNDGSTDNSAEILAEYAAKDSRIKVFTQENAGLSAARNTALEHATGEWVAGVDSDDYLSPVAIKNAMAGGADEVDLVMFPVTLVSEEGVPLPPNDYFDLPAEGKYEMDTELAGKVNVCFWGKLWRRSVIERISLRFPVGLLHEDDAFYYLYVPHVRWLATCCKEGYFYVQRAGSIMRSGQTELQTVQRYIEVIRFVCAECARRGALPDESPWCHLMISRIYRDRYNYVKQDERPVLQNLFFTLAKDIGVLPKLYGDYRFRRMVPVRGWKRWFVSRYVNAEIRRFFGVPYWQTDYQESRLLSSRFILFTRLMNRLKRKL